jgi:chaperonin GroES
VNVKTIEDRVLVKIDEMPNKSEGGLILPETARYEEHWTGTVIAAGSGLPNRKGVRHPLIVKEGDRVLVREYAGTEISLDGEDYLVFKEDDIYAIIEDENVNS